MIVFLNIEGSVVAIYKFLDRCLREDVEIAFFGEC